MALQAKGVQEMPYEKKVAAERIIGKFREGENLASSREGGPR